MLLSCFNAELSTSTETVWPKKPTKPQIFTVRPFKTLLLTITLYCVSFPYFPQAGKNLALLCICLAFASFLEQVVHSALNHMSLVFFPPAD